METFFRVIWSLVGEFFFERMGAAVRNLFFRITGIKQRDKKETRKLAKDYFYIEDSTLNIVVGAVITVTVLFLVVVIAFI